ncbi:TonB-dependent receptor [Sansalvadorimonas sp. 2012CJ34-2]|uniref:TonB-dependent receptor n=1 Tax=Parendozoicomonas callyspongiae TaxID=2942213 RepID=A0ABT0PK81_9GAMM|nr:TonB-dependent receptor [Sansalvadorimonas sp. 2012CJ34-2]MCL6271785.1 TonB-dependent receptor [Sansalvadorimonas sp. 2012CJ34-2]
MHKRRLTTLLLPFSIAVTAQANDTVYTLDDIVVTATRTAQTVDQTLAPVSVISREDIAKSQATSVPELLETLSGVQISQSGGPGSLTSLFIRGTATNQSLVMIDGQRFGSATTGGAFLQYFSPDQIERIEVVRGPRASLYGADAIGGVVNIITRKGTDVPEANLRVGYGSRNTRTASTNLSGSNESTKYNIGINRFLTDGYDVTDDEKSPEDDDDAYSNTSASINVNHSFSENLESGFSLYQSEGVSHYDATSAGYDPRYIFKEQAANGKIKYQVNDNWQSSFDLSYTLNESKAEKDPYPSDFKTRRNAFNWQNDISITDSILLTAGFDYYRDRVESLKNYAETSRDNKAVFLQTQSTFDDSDLQLAVRRDKNQRYGDRTTGNISWGYNLPADLRLIASYGTAFRAPSFNDLYWPENAWSKGNPDLKPENSKNKELELRGQHSLGNWSVAVFQNDIGDMINWATDSTTGKLMPSNVDEARIKGIEMQSTLILDKWTLAANLTLLTPKDRKTDERLIRRAKQTLNINAERSFGRFSLGGTLRAKGDFYDTDSSFKTVKVPGFATVDLRGSWKVNEEFTTELRVTNLLDKEYQTAKGYYEEPRGVFATITWSPKI